MSVKVKNETKKSEKEYYIYLDDLDDAPEELRLSDSLEDFDLGEEVAKVKVVILQKGTTGISFVS
jgi:hypothetical protein